MRQFRQTLGDVLFSSLSLYFNTVGSVCLSCGNDRTRTYELRGEEIYSLRQLPLCDVPKIRKGEDGRVDNSFYDWHYYDDSNSEYTTTIIRLTYIPSPINLSARMSGLEPETPSFGD